MCWFEVRWIRAEDANITTVEPTHGHRPRQLRGLSSQTFRVSRSSLIVQPRFLKQLVNVAWILLVGQRMHLQMPLSAFLALKTCSLWSNLRNHGSRKTSKDFLFLFHGLLDRFHSHFSFKIEILTAPSTLRNLLQIILTRDFIALMKMLRTIKSCFELMGSGRLVGMQTCDTDSLCQIVHMNFAGTEKGWTCSLYKSVSDCGSSAGGDDHYIFVKPGAHDHVELLGSSVNEGNDDSVQCSTTSTNSIGAFEITVLVFLVLITFLSGFSVATVLTNKRNLKATQEEDVCQIW